jgi:hypothetical protein
VRVFVNHTKFVQSLYGVIITLYRQARVDMHPAIPLGPTEKGQEGKYEDYYPKSITGLGGLSLSGAGSSHVFRKDLSQVMLPLVVNPGSLTAEVNGKVKIPDDVFPTISNVPGAMIGFRYYVEVLVDIQGRLASQDRNLANWGGLASTGSNTTTSIGIDGEQSTSGLGGSAIVDTARLRRDKGVISSTFEIIVGTIDSERQKGKRKVESPTARSKSVTQRAPTQQPASPQQPPQPYSADMLPASQTDNAQHHSDVWHGDRTAYDQNGPGYGYDDTQWHGYDVPPTSWHDFEHNGGGGAGTTNFALQVPSYVNNEPPVPMPKTDDESQLSEKERMRRAEARLLPSQAPGLQVPPDGFPASAPFLPDEQEAGPAGPFVPTAPYMPDELEPRAAGDDLAAASEPRDESGPSAPTTDEPGSTSSAFLPVSPSTPRPTSYQSSQVPAYSAAARTLPAHAQSEQQRLPPTDDKREMQRRVLYGESLQQPPPHQPPRFPPMPLPQAQSVALPNNDHAIHPPSHTHMAPTAPMLDEADDPDGLYDDTNTTTTANDSHADAFGSSGLPRYEK